METTSELWSAVLGWAASTGAKNIKQTPGLWYGQTKDDGLIGPLDVRINPHEQEIEGIPTLGCRIGMDDRFPGFIALVGPDGGTLVLSPYPFEDEDGLIKHFRKQTPAPAIF